MEGYRGCPGAAPSVENYLCSPEASLQDAGLRWVIGPAVSAGTQVQLPFPSTHRCGRGQHRPRSGEQARQEGGWAGQIHMEMP
jgi:hypothetical protein